MRRALVSPQLHLSGGYNPHRTWFSMHAHDAWSASLASCFCEASWGLELEVLIGREGVQGDRVDGMVGDPRPDPMQSPKVHNRCRLMLDSGVLHTRYRT